MPGLESAFGAADSLCQTLSGLSEDGYQVPAASGVDRGEVVGEKVIALLRLAPSTAKR